MFEFYFPQQEVICLRKDGRAPVLFFWSQVFMILDFF